MGRASKYLEFRLEVASIVEDSEVIIGDTWNLFEMWGCSSTGFGHARKPSIMANQGSMAQRLRLAASN